MKRYYQPEIETASREEILKIQNEKIVKQVKHVYDNVPYYRNLMDQKGVSPEDIKSVDDIKKLPFLTKDDLREAYPYGLLGTDLKNCVRIQSTSGTTGKRVVAFAGCVTADAEECNNHGIDAFFPIIRGITTLDEALDRDNAYSNLRAAAYQVFNLLK